MANQTREETMSRPDGAVLDDGTQTETARDSKPTPQTPPQTAPGADPKTPSRGSRIRSFWANAEHKTIVFITLASIAILLYLIVNLPAVASFFRNAGSIMRPVILGAVIAYLCDPILRLYEYNVFRRMSNSGARRGLSLFLTLLTVLLILFLVVIMIVPQLIKSFTDLVNNYQSYLNSLLTFLQGIVNRLPVDVDISSTDKLIKLIEDTYGSVQDFYQKTIEPRLNEYIKNFDPTSLFKTLQKVFNGLKDFVLGMFIAFYILGSKDKRRAQIAKARRALFSDAQDARLGSIVALIDKSFGGFIYGKLIDSLIIGILTYILMVIFRVSDYNLLIATFVGVTNVIPVFGPFIGAIPSFLIVLISNPSKAILFLVLILIIQQLDGNVIGPKILGDNTGVSSLAVIIAITVCGSLWGVTGMIIGVPLFAVVIELIKRYLESRLTVKGAPTDTVEYYPKDALGNAEQDVYYEHSTLRYKYEHSKLKPRVDQAISWVSAKFRKRKKTPPEIPSDSADTPDTPADASADMTSDDRRDS